MIFWRKKQQMSENATRARPGSSNPDRDLPLNRATIRPTAADRPTNQIETGPIEPISRHFSAETRRRAVVKPSVRDMDERRGQSEERRLVVDREVFLDGQIDTCDRLIVRGRVEAELTDCLVMELAESGAFKGSATVQTAEIWGRFEGALTVRGNLLIHGTGRVSGIVRYGALEVRSGGEIDGDVQSLEATPSAAPIHTALAATTDENAAAICVNAGQI